ncbi:MAG TPA: lipocalin family protein [Pyrinomonadaceae bacterium]|jgi:apolipoprotein D and lipocalin family protein
MLRRFILGACALLALAAVVKADKKREPLRVVPSVDPGRYAGTWYEIARLPNRFQTKCAGDVAATYTLRSDGGLDVLNRCRKVDGQLTSVKGRARVADGRGPNSKLEVRFAPGYLSFLPFVWGDYQVIDLAPDYSYALVGEPGRKYLWVLSRTPRMDDETYARAVARGAAEGFDVSRLMRTEQSGR